MRFGLVPRFFISVLVFAAGALCVGVSTAAEVHSADRWSASSSDFKVQLHALAAEALMLQIKSSKPQFLGNGRAARLSYAVRRDGEIRLADSLRAANAVLSMLEIAEHSDRGSRVREILSLWLQSSRIGLTGHLKNAGGIPLGASIDPDTAAFLEELKIIWRRLDGAYETLGTLLK